MATNPTTRKKQSDKLIFWGILLFFLGLVSGLFIPMMANPRMGVSSHLEGVMNGTFANFLAVLISAMTGAGKYMPIAGGKEGDPFIESIISTAHHTYCFNAYCVFNCTSRTL